MKIPELSVIIFAEREWISMFQPGDQVLYGVHGVCRILGIEERTVDRKRVNYFVLEPLDQRGARFYVPLANQAAVAKLKRLMNRQELEALLSSEAIRQNVWIDDEAYRKQYYRELITSGDREALLAMICSVYRHKQRLIETGRKFHLCDENFLRDAEKLLSAEFSLVFEIPINQIGDYIAKRIAE